jgi:hypothetical protein
MFACRSPGIQVGQRLGQVGKAHSRSRRDPCFLHQLLSPELASLQLGGGATGAKNGEPRCLKGVHNSLHQGQLRPHHRQADPLHGSKPHQSLDVCGGQSHRLTAIHLLGAAVARSPVDSSHLRGLQ